MFGLQINYSVLRLILSRKMTGLAKRISVENFAFAFATCVVADGMV